MNIAYPSLLFFLFLSCKVFAAMDSQVQATLDIQRELFPEQYQIIDAGGQQVLVIIEENTNAIPRGVAIMMGEAGRSIVSQNGLAPLTHKLNALGWVTMLVQTPNIGAGQAGTKQETVVPQDVSTATVFAHSPVDPMDPQTFLEHEQQLIEQMGGILEKSADYPGFKLIISQGTTAAWLAKIYAQNKLVTPDAFVAISPYWPWREHNRQLADYVAATGMPVLDLHNARDNNWSLQSYPARKIAATKALKLHYRQREIIGLAIHNQQAEYLSKEIYGWLSYMGW
ncbi:MAG: hypothetical protein ACI8Z9_000201 [Paraglaciecola sp.]